MFNEAQAISAAGQIGREGPQLVQAPFISSAIQDIEFLTGLAHEANGNLYDLRQRLFGPWPQSASNSKSETSPPCLEAQLADALARLRAVLQDARENAASLACRI